MKPILLAAISAAGLAVQAGPSAAQSCAPVGRISQILANYRPSLNDGYIQRADQPPIPLSLKASLFPGDGIVVSSPGLIVRYVIGSEDAFLTVDQAHPMARLPLRPSGRACSPPGPFTQAASRGERPSIRQMISRGGSEGPVEYAALLPEGEQWLPASVSRIAPVWSGGAADVRVDGRLVQASDVPFVELVRPPSVTFTVEVRGNRGGKAQWRVGIVQQLPPWPEGSVPKNEVTDDDRLERALWLLNAGAEQRHWRLFALSEIAALRPTSFTADLAWRQIVGGA